MLQLHELLGHAIKNTLVSIILTLFSWFSSEHVELLIKICTGLGACTTSVFAVRYYLQAIKVQKLTKRKLEQELDNKLDDNGKK